MSRVYSSSDLLTFIQWSIDILRKWMRQDTKCARCLIHFRNEADTKCVFRENEADTQCARSNNVSTFRVCFIFENEWDIIHRARNVHDVSIIFVNRSLDEYIYWHSSKMNETHVNESCVFIYWSIDILRARCLIHFRMNETSCTFRVCFVSEECQ